MNRSKTTAVSIKGTALTLTLALMGLTVAGQAGAGCGDVSSPGTEKLSSARSTLAVYRPDADQSGAFIQVWDTENAPIVGLWTFEVHLNGAQNGLPNAALFDWGLATWHSDQTEIQFSAGRPPVAGDVCMGAWKEIGRHKYKLHHIALGLTPPDASGLFVGPAIIRATVTVDSDGDSYTGPYSVTIYPGSPDNGTEFDETGAPLATFTGTITAKRVIAD